MFERFTDDARQTVVDAQVEARALDHGWIGTEHLLLAALRDGSPLRDALEPLGLSYDRVRQDVESRSGPRAAGADTALRDLGIDLDEVHRRVEASFGPGALDSARSHRPRRRFRRRGRSDGYIPFTAEAKTALEHSLRESIELRSGDIRAEHVVLGNAA